MVIPVVLRSPRQRLIAFLVYIECQKDDTKHDLSQHSRLAFLFQHQLVLCDQNCSGAYYVFNDTLRSGSCDNK